MVECGRLFRTPASSAHGTPSEKKEKDTIINLVASVQPTYSIRKAVDDKAVVPLLYESRDVEHVVDRPSIDKWFEIVTANLTKEKKKADSEGRKFTNTISSTRRTES